MDVMTRRWGPFWICTTFLLTLVITSNIGSFINIALVERDLANLSSGKSSGGTESLAPTKTVQQWTHDFSIISVGSGFMYSYMILIPLFIYVLLKWKNATLGAIEAMSLFGYSLSVWFPCAVSCHMSTCFFFFF